MYIIETLPRAGTPMFYRRGYGKWHYATIDTRMLFGRCGTLDGKKPDPNNDDFSLREPSGHRCKKCWRGY